MKREIIDEFGVGHLYRWRERTQKIAAAAEISNQKYFAKTTSCGEKLTSSITIPIAEMDWKTLSATVRECRKCELHSGRRQAVFGVGDCNADWLFVGEGPGEQEDLKGEPFVGRAGQLLDLMLVALGLARGKNVYIANVVKCRPPENRNPKPNEAAECRPYLMRQIAMIKPRLIVALGRVAAAHLLHSEESISRLRQRLHDFDGTPLVVTYHPAYLLRNPIGKRQSWEDLCFARRILKGE